MWDASTAWLDGWCVGLCPGSDPRTLGCQSRACEHNHYTTRPVRSEEHTSELQSRQYLVCRLLLEKKLKKLMARLQIVEPFLYIIMFLLLAFYSHTYLVIDDDLLASQLPALRLPRV